MCIRDRLVEDANKYPTMVMCTDLSRTLVIGRRLVLAVELIPSIPIESLRSILDRVRDAFRLKADADGIKATLDAIRAAHPDAIRADSDLAFDIAVLRANLESHWFRALEQRLQGGTPNFGVGLIPTDGKAEDPTRASVDVWAGAPLGAAGLSVDFVSGAGAFSAEVSGKTGIVFGTRYYTQVIVGAVVGRSDTSETIAGLAAGLGLDVGLTDDLFLRLQYRRRFLVPTHRNILLVGVGIRIGS